MARTSKEQSDTPKQPGRFKQVAQVFTAARKADPTIPWWMLLAALGTLVVAVVVGALLGHWVYALILGIPLALLAATVVLSRKAALAQSVLVLINVGDFLLRVLDITGLRNALMIQETTP